MWEKEKRRGLYFYFSKNKILHVICYFNQTNITGDIIQHMLMCLVNDT